MKKYVLISLAVAMVLSANAQNTSSNSENSAPAVSAVPAVSAPNSVQTNQTVKTNAHNQINVNPATQTAQRRPSASHQRMNPSRQPVPSRQPAPAPAPAPQGVLYPIPVVPDYIAPASKEQVAEIVRVVKKTSFDDDKCDIAKLCVMLRPVFAKDLRSIAKLFSFDSAKVEFLSYAYQFCPDKENYTIVLDALSFSSSKDKIIDLINKHLR